MRAILTYVDQFNSWFDDLHESKRFMAFLGMMALSVFALTIGVALNVKRLMSIGLMTTSVAVFIAAVRAVVVDKLIVCRTLMVVFVTILTANTFLLIL